MSRSRAITFACVSGTIFIGALAVGAHELVVLILGALCTLSIIEAVKDIAASLGSNLSYYM